MTLLTSPFSLSTGWLNAINPRGSGVSTPLRGRTGACSYRSQGSLDLGNVGVGLQIRVCASACVNEYAEVGAGPQSTYPLSAVQSWVRDKTPSSQPPPVLPGLLRFTPPGIAPLLYRSSKGPQVFPLTPRRSELPFWPLKWVWGLASGLLSSFSLVLFVVSIFQGFILHLLCDQHCFRS